MLNKTTVKLWNDKETYTYYTESKPSKKPLKLSSIIGTIAFTVLGIEETICKNIIKLCWGVFLNAK